jgi:DNA-directed RNA polymerase subunit alpha
MLEGLEPKIHTLELTPTYGRFTVEPLERGYGHTLGNALRRVLLAHIPGAAVTAVHIHGALHEFGTLEGVVQDVTEIILNIKELGIRIHGDPDELNGQARVLRVDAAGEGEVLAADIAAPSDVEIVNPGLQIAELSESDAKLVMDMWAERGKGYVRVDELERERRTLEAIPIDAVFSPITRVSYTVEPTRLGYKTDFDRLRIQVTGNGTVPPNEAITMAASQLHEYLSIFSEIVEDAVPVLEIRDDDQQVRNKALDYRIEDLDFSVRTYNCLKKEGVDALGQLVHHSEEELMAIRNFGKRSLTEVVEKLAQFDLTLKEPPAERADALETNEITVAGEG